MTLQALTSVTHFLPAPQTVTSQEGRGPPAGAAAGPAAGAAAGARAGL